MASSVASLVGGDWPPCNLGHNCKVAITELLPSQSFQLCSHVCRAGEIIGRFERKGFKLRALKLYQTPKEVQGG